MAAKEVKIFIRQSFKTVCRIELSDVELRIVEHALYGKTFVIRKGDLIPKLMNIFDSMAKPDYNPFEVF